ncbi:MAG: exo-alpha-sialidase [Clostridia bacterium]|nr:exo-alpha-sialidase [Clostridia bacterium]MBQ6979543.1 exo-alpha-sialidase [Clostridia bacterium]
MNLVKNIETVVYTGKKNEDAIWGETQFPHLYDMPNGNIGLMVHDANDVWTDLTLEPKAKWFVTGDKGKTWRPATKEEKDSMGTALPNGDYLRPLANDPTSLKGVSESDWYFGTKRLPTDGNIVPPKPDKPDTLPRYITAFLDIFGQSYKVYWLDSIPDKMIEKRFAFNRYSGETAKSGIEYSLPDWKYRLSLGFYTADDYMLDNAGLYPCRDVKVAPDGSLYIAHYVARGKGANPFTGAYEGTTNSYFFRSMDNGKTWEVVGYIPYKEPDEEKDKFAHLKEGFSEPDIEFMPDGSMLCILRTCDVFMGAPEWGPTYLSRSVDGGKTWSKPKYFKDRGALPKLLQLKNGITLAVITRPGIYVYASEDCGETWSTVLEIMTDKDRSNLANEVPKIPDFHQWCGSCCNCSIKAISDNSALLAYSDFYIPDENGVKRKGIKSMVIKVER